MRAKLWSAVALLGVLLAYSAPAAMASVAPAPVVAVQTGAAGYLPGTTVTVQGTVMEGGQPMSGVQVALEADGTASGQTYWVDQVTTASDGSFTDQFVMPSNLGQDTSLKIWAVSGGVRASTTVQVQTPAPPTPPPSSGGGAGSGTSTPTCTDQPAGVVLQQQVGSAGGTLTSKDGCVVLTVPEGAFATTTTVTVTESAYSSLPPGDEMAATPVFALDFGGEAAMQPIAAQFTFSSQAAMGEPAARVGLFLQDGSYWQYVKDMADTQTNSVSASIESAGNYLVAVNDSSFNDIPQGYWAQSAIDLLLGRDAISGFPDGGFHPDGVVTRAQFVKMLVLSLGLPLPQTPTSAGFTDVSAGAWYAPYVDAAVSAKLVEGVTPQLFEPDALITRAQLAVMIARAMNGYAPQSPLTVQFNDQEQIPSWALQGVMQAAQAGIVHGLPSGAFDPSGDATRAQAAQLVANLVTVTGQ